MRRISALFVAIILLFNMFCNETYIYAENMDEQEAALILKANASSIINNGSTINELKKIRDAYTDAYNNLINEAEGDLKIQLIVRRESIANFYNEKIEELRIVDRRKKRKKGFQGFF